MPPRERRPNSAKKQQTEDIVIQPVLKRPSTPTHSRVPEIPNNLPTLQHLYNYGDLAWIEAKYLPSQENIHYFEKPSLILSHIQTETDRLTNFLTKLPPNVSSDPDPDLDRLRLLTASLSNHNNALIYYIEKSLVEDELKNERERLKVSDDFDVKSYMNGLRRTAGDKAELKKYEKLEKLFDAYEGHRKSYESFAKKEVKWPGQPSNETEYFNEPGDKFDDFYAKYQDFALPDFVSSIGERLENIPNGKNDTPTDKKKVALKIYEALNPFIKGEKFPEKLDLDPSLSIELRQGAPLLIRGISYDGVLLLDKENKPLFSQILPKDRPPSIFENQLLEIFDALNVYANQPNTRQVTLDDLKEHMDLLKSLTSPEKEEVLIQGDGRDLQTVLPAKIEQAFKDAEEAGVDIESALNSAFEPSSILSSVRNLKDDDKMQKRYFKIDEEKHEIADQMINAGESIVQDFINTPLDQLRELSVDQLLQKVRSMKANQNKLINLGTRIDKLDREKQELEENYPVLTHEELLDRTRELIPEVINKLEILETIEPLTEAVYQSTLNDHIAALTRPQQTDVEIDARPGDNSPQPMLITRAPQQLDPVAETVKDNVMQTEPNLPALNEEEQQLINVGNELLELLRTRKIFNIKSSVDLLPTVNNLLLSLDEINNSYQNLLQESSKEAERVVGMTTEHEALKQLLENTKVELNNTRAQLDEKNRELDSMRTASEAPPTTETQGPGIQTTEPVRTKVITDEQKELRKQLNVSNMELFRAQSQLIGIKRDSKRSEPNERPTTLMAQRGLQNAEANIKVLKNHIKTITTNNNQLRSELAATRSQLAQQMTGTVLPAVETTSFTTQTDPIPYSLQYTAKDYDNLLLERDELKRRVEHLTQQYNALMGFTENQDFQTDEHVVESQTETQAYFDLLQEEQKKTDELRRQLSQAEWERRQLESQLSDEAMRDQIALIQTLQEQLNESEAQKVDLNKKIEALKKKSGHQNIKNFRLKNKINNLRDENEALRNDLDHSHQEYYEAARYEEQTQDQLWRILGNSETSSPRDALSDIQALIQSLKYQKYQLERQLAEQTNEGQALRAAHEQAIKELTDKYEADLQEAKNQYEAKNCDTIAHYDQRLDTQIAQYDVRYGKFRRESEAILKETVNDYVVQIDGLKAAHEVQLARLDADYQAQITALQEELTARDSSLAALTNPKIDQYYRPFFESARVVLNHYTDLIRDEAVKDLPIVRDIFNVFMGDLKERLNLQREMEWQNFKTHTKTAIMTTEHQHATDKQALNQQAQENAQYQNHQHEESMAKLRSDLKQKEKKRSRRAEKQDAQLRAINAANIRAAHNQLASALIGRLIGADDPAAVTHGYSMLAEFTKSLLTLPEDELNHPSIQEYIKMYNDGTLDRLVNVLARPKQPVDDALSKRITDLEGTVRSFINMTAQRTAHVGAAQAYHPPRRVFVGREGVPHQGNRYARGYRSNRRLPPRRPDGRFKRVSSPARKHKK